MVRDINAGRFANKTNLVLVTHGLALRIFLMRWFHWTLDQYLLVHNPPNAEASGHLYRGSLYLRYTGSIWVHVRGCDDPVTHN